MFASARQNFITGGTFVENRQINLTKGAFERLQEAVAPGAFHNSGERFDPPKCHPNTRVAVLQRIMDWIAGLDPYSRDALIMWLYGPAGAGKSAIAQTLAELCYAEGKLLASFFFSKSNSLRNSAQSLVATLAYQLALILPQQVREHITSIVDHDPLIFTRSLEAQFMTFIVQPIQNLAESGFFNEPHAPRLIIIDGLDECDNPRVQCNILDIIFKSYHEQNLPLLFLICSRPETDISSSFDSQSATSTLARLALDDKYLPDEDIELFLIERFAEIKQTHRLRKYIPVSWPTAGVIDTLVRKSSGQFIYAATIVKFVSSVRHRPTDRLEIVLGIRPAIGEPPFAELDALYTQIFSTAEDIERVLTIIGLLVFFPKYGDPCTIQFLEGFLCVNPGDVLLTLTDLNSLISVEEHFRGDSLRILHASLKDFLSDESRSKNLCLNAAERHTQYALICFEHIWRDSADIYILDRLFYHCRRSIHTQEFQKNMSRLTLESVVGIVTTAPEAGSRFCGPWIAEFFTFIESLPWDEDKDLYKKQLASLDQYFMDHLDAYYSDRFLSLLVAALSSGDYLAEPAMPNACKIVDHARLHLGRSLPPDPTWDLARKYRQLVLNFVQDPIRSGRCFLDGKIYAWAALGALSYLYNGWSYKHPPGHSEHYKNHRRHWPRRWRRKWGSNSVLHKFNMKDKPRPRFTRWEERLRPKDFLNLEKHLLSTGRRSDWKDRHASEVFEFSLVSLPHVLSRSDKSEELVQSVRQAKFGSRAKNFPKETRLAKRAIAEYLARVSDGV